MPGLTGTEVTQRIRHFDQTTPIIFYTAARCALNFEAENMIDRFIWRRLMPGLFLFALVLIAFVFLLR